MRRIRIFMFKLRLCFVIGVWATIFINNAQGVNLASGKDMDGCPKPLFPSTMWLSGWKYYIDDDNLCRITYPVEKYSLNLDGIKLNIIMWDNGTIEMYEMEIDIRQEVKCDHGDEITRYLDETDGHLHARGTPDQVARQILEHKQKVKKLCEEFRDLDMRMRALRGWRWR